MADYLERPKKLLEEITKSLNKGKRRERAIEVAKKFPNIVITGNTLSVTSIDKVLDKKKKRK